MHEELVICTEGGLHVGVDFSHCGVIRNNGLQVGSAQPGSAKMLCFLRVCHAV